MSPDVRSTKASSFCPGDGSSSAGFAWLGRSRRLANDFEASTVSATAWLLLANLCRLSRGLARA